MAGTRAPRLQWQEKGLIHLQDLAVTGLEAPVAALGEAVTTPVALLRSSALDHNLRAMRDYCDTRGVHLAPHGKTTMSPELIGLQIEHGAWGITAATGWQARVLRQAGVARILLANEVVDPSTLGWIRREQRADPAFRIMCYVDSVAGVRLMSEVLGQAPDGPPLEVLLEVGVVGGRTGCRDDGAATAVADAVAVTPHLQLRGVAAFEGILGSDRGGPAIDRVDGLLARVRALAERLLAEDRIDRDGVVVTAGGSTYFDRVVALLARGWPADAGVDVVLRSGCYLTHDHGIYSDAVSEEDADVLPVLEPALQVWGRILSRPEPQLAVVDVGKRDVSHDAGLPRPLWTWRKGDEMPRGVDGWETTALNDQHAYLRVPDSSAGAVSDLVGFGISHPCTTFDKWRALHVVDDAFRTTEVVHTWF